MILGSTLGALKHLDTEQAFAFLQQHGIKTVEIGTGGYVDSSHIPVKDMLHSGNAVKQFKELLSRYDLTISALSCCGNPFHPDRAVAAKHHQDFLDTCRLAHALEVDTVVTFSGCPGDCASSKYPNFVSTAWPQDFTDVARWQWERMVLPYWVENASVAYSHGVRRIAMEMIPGFCVYNPQTLWQLRDEIGGIIGATVDPAHLIRQGIDPVTAIRALKRIVYQVHAKDLTINEAVLAENGMFAGLFGDTPAFEAHAVGNGHDADYWKAIVAALNEIGYDRSLTIEHEDAALTAEDGIPLAAKTLQPML
ncbi:MAG: sugar phosphate isomerase/epimerase [Clostridia bacterium]|nr:sugar phosphate isomerase/epimerase [Clostridia bacterium]